VRSTAGAKADRILWLGDFDPEWAGKRAIADPWGKPVEEFQRTFERIERCVNAVVDDLG
jgi:protein-tyrosine-phosphatase